MANLTVAEARQAVAALVSGDETAGLRTALDNLVQAVRDEGAGVIKQGRIEDPSVPEEKAVNLGLRLAAGAVQRGSWT